MNLKKLVEVSPLIAAFLIFNGFLRLHLYYMYWGVNIVDYLDISEILLSFLGDLNIIILLAFLVIVQAYVADGIVGFIDRILLGHEVNEPKTDELKEEVSEEVMKAEGLHKLELPKKISELPNFVMRRFPLLYRIGNIAVLGLTTWLFLLFNNLGLLYFMIVGCLSFFTLLFEEILKFKENVVMYLVLILTFVVFTLGLARREIVLTQKSPALQTWELKTDLGTVSVGGKDYVIGKTRNFTFIYRPDSSMVSILQNSMIKSANLVQRRR